MKLQHIHVNDNKRLSAALLFILFPINSNAANMAGLAEFYIHLITFIVIIWVGLTIGVAYLLRRQPPQKRTKLTLLFLFLPILWIGIFILKEYAVSGYQSRPELTTKTLEVCGANFPSGSHAKYDGEGGFFGWGAKRTLVEIESPHPIQFGDAFIDKLIFIRDYCSNNEARAIISSGTLIYGLPCKEATFSYSSTKRPELISCFLAEPVTWKGVTWDAGSFIHLKYADPNTLARCDDQPSPEQYLSCAAQKRLLAKPTNK